MGLPIRRDAGPVYPVRRLGLHESLRLYGFCTDRAGGE